MDGGFGKFVANRLKILCGLSRCCRSKKLPKVKMVESASLGRLLKKVSEQVFVAIVGQRF
jgi:hypothetical protein